MKFSYRIGAQIFEIEIESSGGSYRVQTNGDAHAVEVVRAADGEFNLLIDGQPHTVHFAMNGAARFIAYDGKTYALNAATRGATRRGTAPAHSDENAVRAPMPGQVRAVNVAAGDAVTSGQTLMLIEAMKMEIKIVAPRAGNIQRVLVKPGDLVEREQVVAEIE
jgi:biotin carboxyl carrier protein